MKKKILGVRLITGRVFYGSVNDGVICNDARDITGKEFEKAMLDYLRYNDRTDNFTNSYTVDLPEYKFYTFKITVEPIPRKEG